MDAPPEVLLDELLNSKQLLWRRDSGHGELVLQDTGLLEVEGCLTDQNGFPMLDGLD